MAFAIVAMLVSCGDDDTPTPIKDNYKENIKNITNNIIVKTYSDLADNAADLVTKATALKDGASEETLTAAKTAWQNTRKPWESSEGFLFGPVGDAGLGTDGAIDSWPVNVVDMQALLDSGNTLDEPAIDAQINEAKGFHLIEYLLWGIDGNKKAADLTVRELEYIVAACENLKNKTTDLHNAWKTTGDNFASLLINANSTEFPSEKAVLETLTSALIVIADEVANGKIEVPLNGTNGGGVDPTQEESRFSHNSKLDFANNVRSIQNVYNGTYLSSNGKGISPIIAGKNAALDTKFKTEITEAIEAIEAISGTFTSALASDRAGIENAQAKVRTVQETLESKIKPLVSGL